VPRAGAGVAAETCSMPRSSDPSGTRALAAAEHLPAEHVAPDPATPRPATGGPIPRRAPARTQPYSSVVLACASKSLLYVHQPPCLQRDLSASRPQRRPPRLVGLDCATSPRDLQEKLEQRAVPARRSLPRGFYGRRREAALEGQYSTARERVYKLLDPFLSGAA